MRVSERQRYDITHNRVERAKSNNADQLETLSTQKRINRISDDPVAAGQSIREKNKIITLLLIKLFTYLLTYFVF